MKKENVHKLVRLIDQHLKALEGTEIQGSKSKIKTIEYTTNKLREVVYKFEPTEYEVNSKQTKAYYIEMQKARNNYLKVCKTGVDSESVKEALEAYKEVVAKYENSKKIRDALKCI